MGPGSVSRLGNRLLAMALLAKRGRPKEQVRNAYSAFYRISEWYGDVITVADMTSPATFLIRHYPSPGNIGKQLHCSRGRLIKDKIGGATVTKVHEAMATIQVQKG